MHIKKEEQHCLKRLQPNSQGVHLCRTRLLNSYSLLSPSSPGCHTNPSPHPTTTPLKLQQTFLMGHLTGPLCCTSTSLSRPFQFLHSKAFLLPLCSPKVAFLTPTQFFATCSHSFRYLLTNIIHSNIWLMY